MDKTVIKYKHIHLIIGSDGLALVGGRVLSNKVSLYETETT